MSNVTGGAKAREVDGSGKTYDRRQCERRLEALRKLRNSWHTRWVELAEHIDPKRGSFYQSAANAENRGVRKDRKVKDGTARRALRTLQNGMMSGCTSQARPWFKVSLGVGDPLNSDMSVKEWISETTKRMLRVFADSNFYRIIQPAYGDLGLFGIAGYLAMEDFEDVVRFYPLVVGEFFVALNSRLEIDTVFREFSMSVSALVGEFGYSACSMRVRGMWDRGDYDTEIDVVHAIEPNMARDRRKVDAAGMPFREVYFEKGATSADAGSDFLRKKGYHEFPAMICRWDVNGRDAYAGCPGMDAIPDVKQLYSQQVWKGKGIAKQVDPTLNAPASMKNEPITGIPGGINYTPDGDTKNTVVATYQPNLRLGDLKEDIAEIKQSIKETFYADLFFAISQMEGVQPRGNKEIEERKDEKFVQLGPVLDRVHGEWLKPTVKRVYALMDRAGLIPPKPDAIADREIDIEFISVLAIAQRAISTVGIERLLQVVGQMFEAFPQSAYKIDVFDLIDEYADLLGVDPRLIVPSMDAQQSMDAQTQQMQQEKALAAVPAVAKSASDLANADVGGGLNALQLMTGQA